MAETRKLAIVRQPCRKYWHGHVAMYRNSVAFCVVLPNGERRGVVLPRARFWSRERREARAEILAHRHLPGTKVPRPANHYFWQTVSVPLVLAEAEGRVWRSRQPVRRYPARPIREGARHG